MAQFSQQHGAVLIFVVQFQTFDEIFIAALFLLLSHLSIDWQEFFEAEKFFTAFFCSAHFLDQCQSWIAVECAQHIAEIEGIDSLCTISIVNLEGEFGFYKILWNRRFGWECVSNWFNLSVLCKSILIHSVT